jgi:hypothetical protein
MSRPPFRRAAGADIYLGLEPLPFPANGLPAVLAPSPARYEGTIALTRIIDGERTFIEWPVDLETSPGEEGP